MSEMIPLDLQQLVNQQLASGHFGSSDEVLREALHLLVEHQAAMADLEASLQDIDEGRVFPLDVVAGEIQRRHGWASP